MTIDGNIVPADPLPAFQAGNFQRKPMIIGTTREEGVLYIYEVWPQDPGFVEIYGLLYLIFKDREVTRCVLDG